MTIKWLLTLCSCTLAISCGPVPDLARTVVNEADRVVPTPALAPACVNISELQDALDQQYDAGKAVGLKENQEAAYTSGYNTGFAAGVASVNCKRRGGKP